MPGTCDGPHTWNRAHAAIGAVVLHTQDKAASTEAPLRKKTDRGGRANEERKRRIVSFLSRRRVFDIEKYVPMTNWVNEDRQRGARLESALLFRLLLSHRLSLP